jgi:hypothetical protein
MYNKEVNKGNHLMKIHQLIDLLIDLGYSKLDDNINTLFYMDNMQGSWVNLDTGEVGANTFDDDGFGSEHCIYDLNDDDECYDAYVDSIAYINLISNPTVSQAIRIQHGSKKFFDILNNVAPGRFDTPLAEAYGG